MVLYVKLLDGKKKKTLMQKILRHCPFNADTAGDMIGVFEWNPGSYANQWFVPTMDLVDIYKAGIPYLPTVQYIGYCLYMNEPTLMYVYIFGYSDIWYIRICKIKNALLEICKVVLRFWKIEYHRYLLI